MPPFRGQAAHTLLAVLHDVPFIIRGNDAEVIARIGRVVQRYRAAESHAASGPQQTLVCIQGEPEIASERLRDIPRRSGATPGRVATLEVPGGRAIYRRETGVLTTIEPERWTVMGDLRAHPGEVVRALDAMLSLALVARGYLTLKGSALRRDDRGLALIGGPDGARRALAVTLVARGFRWVTEDLLLVRVAAGHVEMRGLPGLLRLGPAAMLAHPALASRLSPQERAAYTGRAWRDLRAIETRYEVDPAAAFGVAGIAEGGTLRTIVALDWKGSKAADAPTVLPLARSDAAAALAEATRAFGLYDLSGTLPPNFHRLQRIAETVTMRAVRGAVDLAAVADALAAAEATAAGVVPEVTNGV